MEVSPYIEISSGGTAKSGRSCLEDHVRIGGIEIPLNELLRIDISDANLRKTLRDQFVNAKPFEHLILDGLFNEDLLALVAEEFDFAGERSWHTVQTENQKFRRMLPGAQLGPASQLYYDIIHSGRFVEFLSAVTGVENLVTDPTLQRSGLQEYPTGSWFGVHVDFNKHRSTLLDNELGLLTYLNRGWKGDFGGTLELWDTETQSCTVEVVPEFGRMVLLRHSDKSYHGLSRPVNAPDGRPRRAIAAYYYGNRPDTRAMEHRTTVFYELTRKIAKNKTAKSVIKYCLPPMLIDLARYFTNIG